MQLIIDRFLQLSDMVDLIYAEDSEPKTGKILSSRTNISKYSTSISGVDCELHLIILLGFIYNFCPNRC